MFVNKNNQMQQAFLELTSFRPRRKFDRAGPDKNALVCSGMLASEKKLDKAFLVCY
jgi:hypothetical protein